jgi:hypothetical protein
MKTPAFIIYTAAQFICGVGFGYGVFHHPAKVVLDYGMPPHLIGYTYCDSISVPGVVVPRSIIDIAAFEDETDPKFGLETVAHEETHKFQFAKDCIATMNSYVHDPAQRVKLEAQAYCLALRYVEPDTSKVDYYVRRYDAWNRLRAETGADKGYTDDQLSKAGCPT